jgi:hypothetical protein
MGGDTHKWGRDKAGIGLSAAQLLCAKAVMHCEPMLYAAPGAQVHMVARACRALSAWRFKTAVSRETKPWKAPLERVTGVSMMCSRARICSVRVCKAESGEEFCTCICFRQGAMSEAYSFSGPITDETSTLTVFQYQLTRGSTSNQLLWTAEILMKLVLLLSLLVLRTLVLLLKEL